MNRYLAHITETIGRWLRQPTTELNRWQRTVRFWVELSRHCARELRRDRAGEKAAALTYHTLFSLLPTLVLMLVILQTFVGQAERQQFKEMVVNWLIEPMQVEQAPQTPAPADGTRQTDSPAPAPPPPRQAEAPSLSPDEQAALAQAQAKRAEFNQIREDLKQRIEQIFAYLENVNFRSIGAVGLLLFIWGATGLLASIEKSFNAIFGMSRSRPWFMRLPLYYTVITLGPVVMLGGQWMQRRFMELIATYAWTQWFAGPAVVLSPLLTTWLVLALMYILLPNTSVKVRPAMIGSFVAAVLWVTAIEAMTLYIGKASTASLYGALALLPLFLLWLWVMWLIILFGLELTYALQTLKGRHLTVSGTEDQPLIVDPAAVVPLAAQIAQSFRRGRSCTLEQLCQAVNLPAGPVEKMLGQLEKQRLVHRLEHDGEPAFTLAQPADQVKVFDLLNAMEAIAAGPRLADQPQARRLIDQMRQHASHCIDSVSLDDLLGNPPQRTSDHP